MEKTREMKDPLFHIVKRDNVKTSKLVGIKAVAVVLALILSSILLAITLGCNPITFIGSLFTGSFASYSLWDALKEIAILLSLGLALLPAFKMKFWNTGADGQALIGALAAYMCLYFMGGKIPDVLLVLISLVAAVLAGIVWAVIPAIFKALWNTNEILFTLMMNYIAIQCVAIFINKYSTGGSNTLPNIYEGSLPMIHEYLTLIIITGLLVAAIAIYIKKTKHGFELSLVGESVNTAKYVGINVKKVVIRTLVVSGAICGLVGFMLTNGLNHVVNTDTLGGQGFTAIIVVWLANFNPYFMILTAFLIIFLKRGSAELLSNIGQANDSIPLIVTSIFIFFIIGCTFFSRYKIMFRYKTEESILEEKNKKINKVKAKMLECQNSEIDEKEKEEMIKNYMQEIDNIEQEYKVKLDKFKEKERQVIDNKFVDFFAVIFSKINSFFGMISDFIVYKIFRRKRIEEVEVKEKITTKPVTLEESSEHLEIPTESVEKEEIK